MAMAGPKPSFPKARMGRVRDGWRAGITFFYSWLALHLGVILGLAPPTVEGTYANGLSQALDS